MKINRVLFIHEALGIAFEHKLNQKIKELNNDKSVNGIIDIKFNSTIFGHSALIIYDTNIPI